MTSFYIYIGNLFFQYDPLNQKFHSLKCWRVGQKKSPCCSHSSAHIRVHIFRFDKKNKSHQLKFISTIKILSIFYWFVLTSTGQEYFDSDILQQIPSWKNCSNFWKIPFPMQMIAIPDHLKTEIEKNRVIKK